MTDVIGQVIVVSGALVFASAALGVIRFRDPYGRISAVGTAGGVGIVLIVVGALFLEPTLTNLVMVVLIIAVQLVNSAIGSMAIARSSYLTGIPLKDPEFDELANSESTEG